ncbi:scavenger receptor class b type-1 sr-b1 [Holotrichia oblita]|uniref:Scavenger receptor class b type-1 sr-b1 n=1 Tax=Holotrichia oblita TaxID=644536 RepID=A0ACB9T3E3_HOLOL|nr:scavenger receptor class b type-1 sr-b1 [Holotrichia oblita]
MYPKRTDGKRCALACASLLAAIGTLLMFFAPWFYTIVTNFALSLTSKPTFNLWQKTPMPLYLEFYMFNWTNPEEVHKRNVKPHFQEIGPFVFRETKEKVNITWNQNNTITFNHLRYWYFEESKSCCKLSTQITTINAIALIASHMIENWSYVIRKGFDISLSALSAKLWKVTTVDEILFSGYEDALINLARSMPQLQSLSMPDYDKFGWFYQRNGSYSYDGTFNMEYSGPNFGNTREWQYNDYLSYYDKKGECNTVRGSAGEFFSPNRQRDEIGFFSPDICRYVPLTYQDDKDIDGTTGYKYVMGDSWLDNGTKVPENRCYCGDFCTPYGALNISACKHNAPGFVSQPHFYDADPYYLDKISGLNPTKEKHQMFMVIEPETGIPLHVEARLQLNLLVKPIKSIR